MLLQILVCVNMKGKLVHSMRLKFWTNTIYAELKEARTVPWTQQVRAVRKTKALCIRLNQYVRSNSTFEFYNDSMSLCMNHHPPPPPPPRTHPADFVRVNGSRTNEQVQTRNLVKRTCFLALWVFALISTTMMASFTSKTAPHSKAAPQAFL